ncbi:MAG: hypothetical protein IJ379_04075, partial [Lachnospiraceae bacterium]|nr:hypothetical protein [Lachnospiraceae bacterium]
MKRKIKRWLTMILSLALIVGSIQYTPMVTVASGGTSEASVTDGNSTASDGNNTVTGGDGGGNTATNITPAGTEGEDISYKASELGVEWSTADKSATEADQLALTFSSGKG